MPLTAVLFIYVGCRINALSSLSFENSNSFEIMNDPFLMVNKNAQFKPLIEGSDIMVLQNLNPQSIHQMPYANKLATIVYTWGSI